MALLKVSLVIVVAFLAICNCEDEQPITRDDSNNIIQCINPAKAKLLLENIPVSIKGKFLQKVTKTVVFPSQGVNTKPITCIKVLDRDQDGRGAHPQIVSGGLNYYDVTIKLESQVSRGINSNIEIYADQ